MHKNRFFRRNFFNVFWKFYLPKSLKKTKIKLFSNFFQISVDDDGKKKTLSVTHQCCRGYGRKKNSQSANIFMPCEELHLRSLIETSERLGGREFVRSAQKNDIDDELRKNVTLFLPNDSTFTEFAEQLLESVSKLTFT